MASCGVTCELGERVCTSMNSPHGRLDARFTVRTRRQYHGSSLSILAPCRSALGVRTVSKHRITIQARGTGFIGPLLFDLLSLLVAGKRSVWSHCIPACSKVHRRIQGLGACRTLSLTLHAGAVRWLIDGRNDHGRLPSVENPIIKEIWIETDSMYSCTQSRVKGVFVQPAQCDIICLDWRQRHCDG
jgi:hypothetical protein